MMFGKARWAIVGFTLLSALDLSAATAADSFMLSGYGAEGKIANGDNASGCTLTTFNSGCGCSVDCGTECGDDCCGGEVGCGDGCSSCCSLGEPFKLDCHEGGIDFGGWWQGGYTSKSTGMFNNIPDRFNTHQAWLYAEKAADGSSGLDWGFRADMMYGIDSGDTQAFGNNPGRWDFVNGWDRGAGYGWAMPQLYLQLASGDWSVIAGHFYTLLGYEVVTAPDNFFFSHAYTMYNSEAFTHTGVLATYSASDNIEIYGGWTMGWDTGFDQFGNGSSFLGGVKVSLSDNATYTYICTAGDMGVRGDGYSHSNVLDLSLTDKLNWVLQSDMVSFGPIGGGQNDEVGLNQYLIYSVNDCLGVGARLEWWKSDAGFNHGGQSIPQGGSVSYYEATFGVNIKPQANLTIRPELRYDWFPHADYDMGIGAVDVILTF
jgi:putative OmpL-like beta-barrel porin-2